MQIDNMAVMTGDSIFYDQAFMQVLEDHVSLLKTRKGTREILLDKQLVYKYEFDIPGLLALQNIPFIYHWITLRCNDLDSPNSSLAKKDRLIVPDFDYIEVIRQKHMSVNRIK